MKDTIIYTMEVTEIVEAREKEHGFTPAEAFKDMLDADDVVVTKVQIFEGTDRDEEEND